MAKKFKIGDKVRAIDSSRDEAGHNGEISTLVFGENSGYDWRSQYPNGSMWYWDEGDIELVEPRQEEVEVEFEINVYDRNGHKKVYEQTIKGLDLKELIKFINK